MATAVKKCRVCGKTYEACRTMMDRAVGVFRWQEWLRVLQSVVRNICAVLPSLAQPLRPCRSVGKDAKRLSSRLLIRKPLSKQLSRQTSPLKRLWWRNNKWLGRAEQSALPYYFYCGKEGVLERASKFNVGLETMKRTYDGIVFDSVLEMEYYRDVLCPLEKSGDVVYYELQKPYELQPKFIHDEKTVQPIKYVADFFIRYKDGHEEVIDTKGCPDQTALLKRKLFWYRYPDVTYRWICYSKIDGGWCDYEFVKKQRAERKRKKKAARANENKEGQNDG